MKNYHLVNHCSKETTLIVRTSLVLSSFWLRIYEHLWETDSSVSNQLVKSCVLMLYRGYKDSHLPLIRQCGLNTSSHENKKTYRLFKTRKNQWTAFALFPSINDVNLGCKRAFSRTFSFIVEVMIPWCHSQAPTLTCKAPTLWNALYLMAMIYSRGHLDSRGTFSLNVRMTCSIIPHRVTGPTLSRPSLEALFLRHKATEAAFLSHKRTLRSIAWDETMDAVSWWGLFVWSHSLEREQLLTITDNHKRPAENCNEGLKRRYCNAGGMIRPWFRVGSRGILE